MTGRTLPASLAEHARRFATGAATPAEPRLAATVLLLRDAAGGLEVYMIRRVLTMAFASGMYAFPGGSVDPRDAEHEVGWAGGSPQWWAGRLGLSTGTPEPAGARGTAAGEGTARAIVCAAVRETFEESGVLLAGPDPHTVVGDVSGDDWEVARQALVAHEVGFADLLYRWRLLVRTDLLAPWARWITPAFEPRRYDTYFFLAAMPELQRTRDVGGEADRTVWVRPADALAQHEAGELGMLPPTAITLRELSGYDDVAGALAAAGTRQLEPIEPRAVFDGDRAYVVLPGEPGY